MLTTLKLCNFETLYLWIFVLKVLIVLPLPIDGYKIDDRGGGPLLIKPYPYQLLDDTDDLLNGRSSSSRGGDVGDGTFAAAAIPVWRTYAKDKHQPAHLLDFGGPLSFAIQAKSGGSDIWQTDDRELEHRQEGYPMTSSEIGFENLNDFDINLIRNAIWVPASPKYLNERNNKQPPLLQSPRLTLRPLAETPTNIRYGKNDNLPMFLGKRHDKLRSSTSFLEQLRKADDHDNEKDNDNGNDTHDEFDGDGNEDDNGRSNGVGDNHKNEAAVDNVEDADDVNDASEAKDDEFPSKYNDTTSNYKAHTDASAHTNSADGHESLSYSAKKEIVRNNFNDRTKGKEELEYANIHDSRKRSKATSRDKKKPKSFASTPFLPAVSGGAMTNLGKFFRDLSKNVQFSEKHQWTSEEQKLLEGDPTFGNLQHHLSEPHLKSDQTGEWIKAIRFYRPSQKIRSLVAMNPHGQWAHGSQFLDPNYMWVGLGK